MIATIIGDLLNWLTAYWDELLVFFALLGGATLGVGLAVWIIARGPLAKINKDTAAVVGQFAKALSDSQTALTMTASTLAGTLERETKLNQQLIALENEIDDVRDDLKRTVADNREVCDQLTKELVRLKQLTKQQEVEIADLRRGSERKDAQLEQLRTQVQSLRRQLDERDQKIGEMELALDRSDRDKRELLDELRRLEGRLNGKADKAVEAVVDSAEVTVGEQEPPSSGESGEHAGLDDGSQESVDKSVQGTGETEP